MYIRETGSTLEKRLSEHQGAVKKNDSKNGIAVHTWKVQWKVDWEAASQVGGNELHTAEGYCSNSHQVAENHLQPGLWPLYKPSTAASLLHPPSPSLDFSRFRERSPD